MLKFCNFSIYKLDNYFNKFRCFYCSNFQINKLEGNFNGYDIKSITSQISNDILSYINPYSDNLKNVVKYSFNASGKMIRPQIVILMAAVINEHFFGDDDKHTLNGFSESQYQIALIAEMIHTASLMHDDLIDRSTLRRGFTSTYIKYGPEKTILGGDYVIIKASQMLANIGNCEAVAIIAELINDLIKGEIMQLTRYSDIDEKFAHYYKKTYRKTASLIANTCKAVCLLSTSNKISEKTLEAAFEFGRNLGMTFQLIDDILDVTASQEHLGKPCQMADLKLGLATGPILFASEQFPEVEEIVLRKLSHEGDFEKVIGFIEKAKGVERTRMVAQMHFDAAMRILRSFKVSEYRSILEKLSEDILTRTK